jgi:hypothetical protein
VEKWWHVSWKRLGRTLLILFGAPLLLLGAALLIKTLIDYQFAMWSDARQSSRDYPEVNLIPVELADKSIAKLSGTHIESTQISFDVPWTGDFHQYESKGSSIIAFKSGANIDIQNPPEFPGIFTIMRTELAMKEMLGRESSSSDYALFAAKMDATPDRVKWWKTRGQNSRDYFLLSMKAGSFPAGGPLYKMNFVRMRGFQEGDPSKPPYKTHLDLFDSSDHHYELTISGSDDNGPAALKQAELNAIVASIMPTPIPQKCPGASEPPKSRNRNSRDHSRLPSSN